MIAALTTMHPEDMAFTSIPGVILLDGTRYYNVGIEHRLKTRGRVNYYSYDGKEGTFHFRRSHEAVDVVYDQETEVTGAGDVWFTSPNPKREATGPNLLSARATVMELDAKNWWDGAQVFGGIPDNMVWDMRLVLMARGREGGGRGKTKREPLVTWQKVEGDATFGIPDIDALVLQSTNRHQTVLHDNEHTIIDDRGPYLEGYYPADTKLWIAGRSFIFTDERLLRQVADLGIIGRLPMREVEVPNELRDDIYKHMEKFPDEYHKEHFPRIINILSGKA